jgi:hypothetical protein
MRQLLIRVRYRVGDKDLRQGFVTQERFSAIEQQAMRGGDVDAGSRAGAPQRIHGFDYRASRGDHVIDDEAGAIADIADDMGDLRLRPVFALLVEHNDRSSQALRVGRGHLHPTGVGRNHQSLRRQRGPQPFAQNGYSGQAVHGHMKESLDLRRVRVDDDHLTHARRLKQRRYQACRDRLTSSMTFIRARIAEVRDDSSNMRRRCTAAGINKGEQFHQVFMHRRAGRLNDKHVLSPHGLGNLNC